MRARAFTVVAFLTAFAGCQVLGSKKPRSHLASATEAASPRVEFREPDERPRLTLVLRQGDPFAAVAVAIAHDLGSEASVALSALLEARLVAAGFSGAQSRAHQLGSQTATLVSRADEAARFVAITMAALRRPVAAGAPELSLVRQRLAALRSRTVTGQSELAALACSGELGVQNPTALLDPGSPAGLSRLESLRKSVVSTQNVGFAALGAEEILDAAARALDDGEPWPDDDGLTDPWPAQDLVGVDGGSDGERRLTLALRIEDANLALEAAPLLAKATGPLAQRLDTLDAPWQIERAVATARARGACLRLDLRAPKGDPGPRLLDVARVAVLALEETDAALGSVPSGAWTLEESVLRPSDPRDAASVAAWRSLTGHLAAGQRRRIVSYQARAIEVSPASSTQLARDIDAVQRAAKRSGLEQRGRVEHGQSELWALLASPCGTRGEGLRDAGLSALALHALAAQRNRMDDVMLEPWVTPDGVGLLAHAPPRGPEETPAAQARRIGGALGRALSARLAGGELARARERLLAAIGPGPRPAWWSALDAVAPEHPSWLEPRGSFLALSEAATQSTEARRRAVLQGPLRLSVLANRDQEQLAVVAGAAERWIRLLRPEPTRCPVSVRIAARSGEVAMESADREAAEAPAYVAVPLPTIEAGLSREAEWTAFLLNRPGGWLDQALRAPNGSFVARARVLGGSRATALLIEVHAAGDVVRGAVAQVRGLLDRLARGAVTPADFEVARKHFEREGSLALLDPRRRVVDLWRGESPRAPADLAALRRFLGALRQEAHVVVYLRPRETG